MVGMAGVVGRLHASSLRHQPGLGFRSTIVYVNIFFGIAKMIGLNV